MPQNTVQVNVRFINMMQQYSGGEREVAMDLSPDPEEAIELIIDRCGIPWAGKIEKFTRVFINKQLAKSFVKGGKQLQDKDTIMFIPMSGGG